MVKLDISNQDDRQVLRDLVIEKWAISPTGLVYNRKTGNQLNRENVSGRYRVALTLDGNKPTRYYLDELVWLIWGELELWSDILIHLDGNYLNNNINNLEWSTKSGREAYIGSQMNTVAPDASLYQIMVNTIGIWESVRETLLKGYKGYWFKGKYYKAVPAHTKISTSDIKQFVSRNVPDSQYALKAKYVNALWQRPIQRDDGIVYRSLVELCESLGVDTNHAEWFVESLLAAVENNSMFLEHTWAYLEESKREKLDD